MDQQPPDKQPEPRAALHETSVVRVMTSTSVSQHPTAVSSTQLPALAALLNADEMTTRLRPLLAPLAAATQTPVVSYARLLAFKQGNRGLLAYDIANTARATDQTVYGKLYPAIAQAVRVEQVMQRLWGEVFWDDPELHVPRPLGCLTENAMLLYVPAHGQLLHEALQTLEGERLMRLVGRWLARLHGSGLDLDRRFNESTELRNVGAWATLVGTRYPALAADAARIAAALQERVHDMHLSTDTPIHKDFHYAHVVANGGVSVIDFDEMRMGDPNFDLAHFCANLHLLSFRDTSEPYQYSSLQSQFLQAYAEQTGWQPNERFVFIYAYTCLKIAKQLCTRRGLRPRPEGDEQDRQTRQIIAQGVSALPPVPAQRFSQRFATRVFRAEDTRR